MDLAHMACVFVCALGLGAPSPDPGADVSAARTRMVREQIERRGIHDERVLAALRTVPRHLFVPVEIRSHAYEDRALPIGRGQTISQPYIVAYMTATLRLGADHRLFELGTGSGYQAAVASRLVAEVYTVEIVEELADRARAVLASLGYENVHVRAGDGWRGWPERAPFDRILVTAAAETIPPALLEQLALEGRMILPLGPAGGPQALYLVEKDSTGAVHTRRLLDVRFVPVTGDHED